MRTSSKSAESMQKINKNRNWEMVYTRFQEPINVDNLEIMKKK